MVALLILSKKDVPEPVHVGDFLQRHACPTRIPHFSVMVLFIVLELLRDCDGVMLP